jgi:hypothetical protein
MAVLSMSEKAHVLSQTSKRYIQLWAKNSSWSIDKNDDIKQSERCIAMTTRDDVTSY